MHFCFQGPEFLLCGENEEVAVVKDTAKWLFAVHKKTGMYGKLRNDVATEVSRVSVTTFKRSGRRDQSRMENVKQEYQASS